MINSGREWDWMSSNFKTTNQNKVEKNKIIVSDPGDEDPNSHITRNPLNSEGLFVLLDNLSADELKEIEKSVNYLINKSNNEKT